MSLIAEWFNNELLERVLKNCENYGSIRVVEFLINVATGKGDNYTSDLLRVSVKFMRKQGNKEVEDKMSVIVKSTRMFNEMNRELVEKFNVVDVEVKMMTSTLVEMEKLLGDTKLFGKCLYTQEDPAFMIIEDLTELGFQLADRQVGLDFHHSLLAIRNLAKFHASSVAVIEKDPSCKNIYNKGIFCIHNDSKESKVFFDGAIESLSHVVRKWPELGDYYADKLMKLSKDFYEFFANRTALDENEFNVINHGDFWINNMLFRYDQNKQVVDHIFVDFQVCIYKSPAIDINNFIHASVNDKILMNHRDQLLDEYLNVLTLTMRTIGCKAQPPCMNDLTAMLRKYELCGLLAACVCLPNMLLDKKDAKNIDEMVSENQVLNVALSNPLYLKQLSKKLPIWDEMGLLDI